MKISISTILLLCFVHFFLSCSAARKNPVLHAPQDLMVWVPPKGILGDFLKMDGAAAKLIWDANSESDIKGYRVFFRQPNEAFSLFYETIVPEYSLAEFSSGVYHFVVQAVDQAGNTSLYSSEVTYNPMAVRTVVPWPDKKPIKLLPVYVKQDTLGNPLTPTVIVEWRQMLSPDNPSSGYDSGWRMLAVATGDYNVAGDTLILNSSYLSQFSATYTLTQDFRIYLQGSGGKSDYAYTPNMFKFQKTAVAGVPKPITEVKVF